jgi:hypothetical protein
LVNQDEQDYFRVSITIITLPDSGTGAGECSKIFAAHLDETFYTPFCPAMAQDWLRVIRVL